VIDKVAGLVVGCWRDRVAATRIRPGQPAANGHRPGVIALGEQAKGQ
jgi:hypothetical protein